MPYVDHLDFPVISDKNAEYSQFTGGKLETMTVPGDLIDTLKNDRMPTRTSSRRSPTC